MGSLNILKACYQNFEISVTVSRGQRVHDRPVYPDKVEGPGKGIIWTMTSKTMKWLLNGMKLRSDITEYNWYDGLMIFFNLCFDEVYQSASSFTQVTISFIARKPWLIGMAVKSSYDAQGARKRKEKGDVNAHTHNWRIPETFTFRGTEVLYNRLIGCISIYGSVSRVATPPPPWYGSPLRGEIPRGCPGIWTPQAVNSSFTRRIASAKSWAKRCQKTHVCGKVQLYSKVDSIHVQALRRSMSIKGFPKRLKTGNKQTQFSLDRSMPFQNCGQMNVRMLYKNLEDVKHESAMSTGKPESEKPIEQTNSNVKTN